LVRPRVVVALGATAALALFGQEFRVTRERGKVFAWTRAPLAMATVHPSSILRALDDEARRRERELFANDLRALAKVLREPRAAA
jgi:DNA polymerase